MTPCIAFTDDDGMLVGQLAKVGKSRAKHWMSGDVWMASLLVKLPETSLHTRYVAQDTVGWQERQNTLKHAERMLQVYCIDDHLGLKASNLIKRHEPLHIIHEAEFARIDIVDSHFVVEGKKVGEE